MNETINEPESRFQVLVAILIAIASVMGAFLAWRASVVADAAGDADFAGIRASTFAAETRSLNFVNAYEHFGSYTTYASYNELGTLIKNNLAGADLGLSEEERNWQARQMGEAFDLAKANLDLFPARYMDRKGDYDVKREMGELWADAAKEMDLNPDPQYKEADRLRLKTNQILGMITFVGIGLVFYTLIEIADDRLKYLLVTLGSLFVFGGTFLGLYIDFLAK